MDGWKGDSEGGGLIARPSQKGSKEWMVDRIVNAPTDGNDNPIDRIVIRKVTIVDQ